MIPKGHGRFPAFAKPAAAGEARLENIMLQSNIETPIRSNRIGSWSSGAWTFAQRTVSALADFAARARSKQSRAVWLPWAMIALKGAAVVAVVLYLGTAAMLYFTQRSMMYFPETLRTPPAQAGLPEAEAVALTAADGENLVAWYVAPREDRPIVLYFHGNGGALRYRVGRFRTLIRDGLGLLGLEYRGYAGSSGSPSEQGLMADGEAAYSFVAARYPAKQIVVWGESLGTGVAVALAAAKPVGRVILEAPFTSAADVAALRYWYLPIRLLMKDQYRSDERIGKITAPVLILHGLHDRTVPYAMGERLFEQTKAPKHIVKFLDGDHEDLDARGALHAVGRFLAGDLDKPPHP
jgi:fermentation-respiration switch protein FrsA (DUF1100 family)